MRGDPMHSTKHQSVCSSDAHANIDAQLNTIIATVGEDKRDTVCQGGNCLRLWKWGQQKSATHADIVFLVIFSYLFYLISYPTALYIIQWVHPNIIPWWASTTVTLFLFLFNLSFCNSLDFPRGWCLAVSNAHFFNFEFR